MHTKGVMVITTLRRAFPNFLKFLLPFVLVGCLSLSAFAAYEADPSTYVLDPAPAYLLFKNGSTGAIISEFQGTASEYYLDFNTNGGRYFSIGAENVLVPELPHGRYLTGFVITQHLTLLVLDTDDQENGASWRPYINQGVPDRFKSKITIYDSGNIERFAYVIPDVSFQTQSVDHVGGDVMVEWDITYSYTLSEEDYFEFATGYIKSTSLPQFQVTYPVEFPGRDFLLTTSFSVSFSAARLSELSDVAQQIIRNQNENAAAIESRLDKIENALPDPDYDYSAITGSAGDDPLSDVFVSIFDDGVSINALALDGGLDLLSIRDGLSFWGKFFFNLENEVSDYAKLLRIWGYIALSSLLVGSATVSVGAIYVHSKREERDIERNRSWSNSDFDRSWNGRFRGDRHD